MDNQQLKRDHVAYDAFDLVSGCARRVADNQRELKIIERALEILRAELERKLNV